MSESIVLFIHVEDQLIACINRSALDKFRQEINTQFKCTDSAPIGYFFVLYIHRQRAERKLYISQTHHMKSVFQQSDLSSCNSSKMPFPSGFCPIPATDTGFAEAKIRSLAQIVGYILYASTTSRPDLLQPASFLFRFIGKWSKTHSRAEKNLLTYIKGTSDLSLVFNVDSGKHFVRGYADADWGGNLDPRR